MKKLLPFFLTSILYVTAAFANENSLVRKGVLDLRNYDWQKYGMVELNGEWEFYAGRFISPGNFSDPKISAYKQYIHIPSFWNKKIQSPDNNTPKGFGFATYHAVILCPQSKENLSLKLLTIASAYRLYINGKEVLAKGIAGQNVSSTVPDMRPEIINLQPAGDTIDIVMHVSNFCSRNGGLWDFVVLGVRKNIYKLHEKELAIGFAVSGAFFLMFIFYFVLFLHFRRRFEILYFSLLCLIVMARSLTTAEIPLYSIADVTWSFVRRMEYISFYSSVPVMAAFSYYLFPLDFPRKMLYFFTACCIPFIFLSIFTDHYIYTYPVLYYQGLMLIAAICGFYVYIRALKNKRPGSLIFFSGFLIFILCIFNDILSANLITETVPLFYVGLTIFVISLSFLLARQFSGAFKELRKSNNKLSHLISDLNLKNDEIKNKNNELEKINHELDSFVNRTSHDLRGPVTSALGLIEVIKDEDDTDTLHTYMDMQERTLLRMDDMIKDIINFSRNKRLDTDLQEINFEKIIGEALEDSRFYSNSENLERTVNVNQPSQFLQDETRIKIIINNLVSNAIKYADVAKDNPFVHITADIQNGNATLKISDNGIGVEERHLDKIFTMFYRATSSAGGSGLGLYIVKETVEKIGGNISFMSRKGEGTEVIVTIPAINKKN